MIHRGLVIAVALLVVVLATATVSSAEIYRYVDEAGEIHLVDDISLVPSQYREKSLRDVEARRGGGSFNVTHDDASQTQAAPSETSAAPAPAAQASDPIKGEYDEAWWRSQAQDQRRKIDELDQELTQLKEDEANESQIYSRPGAARGHRPAARRHSAATAAVLSDSDDEDYVTVEELEAALTAAKAGYADLEERARRAGVPPGWLR